MNLKKKDCQRLISRERPSVTSDMLLKSGCHKCINTVAVIGLH